MPSFTPRQSSSDTADGTLFERMRQHSYRAKEIGLTDAVGSLSKAGARDVVIVDTADKEMGAVRFSRGEQDGKPAVFMQELDSDGIWHETWSLPSDSVDAREGMIGWLNTQSHRWDKFARMLHCRGPDELTHWIFELMVVPATGHALPPRYEPQQWQTIDHYAQPRFQRHNDHYTRQRHEARVDRCICRTHDF